MNDQADRRWRQLADSPIDDRIDVVCDDFEQAWISGDCPDLSSFLPRVDQADRSLLFRELLLVDVEYRRQRRRPLDKSAYLREFPEFAAELETIDLAVDADATTPNRPAAQQRTSHNAGQHIDRFRLVKKVGAGGGGEVWHAHDPGLRRDVAIKIAHARSGDELLRFVREGQSVASLRHPHIVTVHDAWSTDEAAYMVTDFYEGADLKQRLAAAPLSAQEAAELCATLAEALDYAHDCGVIHRDLKPANILLDAKGSPHIADFGLAKWSQDASGMTLDGQLLGTVAYMSPEQARGEAADADRRTDVYSLGVMLYEMLSGACPFVGDQASVLHAIAVEEPARPRALNSTIPVDLETICLKAIDREVERRYPSAGEMAADLRRYLRGDPILARRRGALSRSWRYVRRRPALVACLLLSVAVASAFASVQALRARNRELQGLRSVTLATEPAGATVVFVPLDPTTLEPIPGKLVTARGRSPVTEDLMPGDYLVVAALDDGRFHEAPRHVPARGEALLPASLSREDVSKSDGSLELRSISIPDSEVAAKMTLIEVNSPTATSYSERRRGRPVIHSFYVDRDEFSVADLERVEGKPPHAPPLLMNHAKVLGYHSAARLAELAGKRLPTAAEFEYVATAGGTQRYPWGNAPPDQMDPQFNQAKIGPLGEPTFDRLTLDPRVRGLASNVAEWTMSVALDESQLMHPSDVRANGAPNLRIVKGGIIGAVGKQSPSSHASCDPLANESLPADVGSNPRIGFRGYRSAKPRLTPEDFAPPQPAGAGAAAR